MTTRSKSLPLLAAAALILTLSACGGGSDGPVTDDGEMPGDGETAGLTAEEIEAATSRVIASFDGELFAFGGAVSTCAGLKCPLPNLIYLDSATNRSAAADWSGFEFVGERNGVSFAEKAEEAPIELGTTSFRSLVGWMSHSAFRIHVAVDAFVFAGNAEEHVRYELFSSGDATGTNPVIPPGGSATWSGAMAGVVIPVGTEFDGSFVSGDARIVMGDLDLHSAPSVDVEFGNIVNERTGRRMRDMAWEGVAMVDGAFASPKFISAIDPDDPVTEPGEEHFLDRALEAGIFGRFHGPRHEEAGGMFIRDGIVGAFAAGRDK